MACNEIDQYQGRLDEAGVSPKRKCLLLRRDGVELHLRKTGIFCKLSSVSFNYFKVAVHAANARSGKPIIGFETSRIEPFSQQEPGNQCHSGMKPHKVDS